MADELVHYEVHQGIATITLDSPHNRNALSARLRAGLRAGLTEANRDDSVRIVVLTHTGPVFCSGMDLKEAGDPATNQQGVSEFPKILEQIWTSPKPVVGRIAGPARAGGVGIVAACDIAVAVQSATFAFSEVRIGVVPAVISVTVLPRMLPRAAHELFLTGETFDAERAVSAGLINSAVAPADLDGETRRYTDMLALGGPNALAATKQMLRQPRRATLAEDFADMLELSARHFASEEGQEGIAAFRQKRTASWVPWRR
ncbi:enoyl-CoA hydratase-related protein [Goodfellowiella coeruleoviolacea]|uniref:Methylglutaconyl-CoA hydratase n=1 Tax=Goodfellowiella coeruleoviolacea TaxID=334858 RepID=A0AAE3GDB9_9PSEU|nr:enoyl-CoA hydratase-related protein [Goodfellowiella coeruleoviolacea]MCP2165162.1 methylglutaconyl-CoA hydratase [Goodfellowiella coeruleoviolacea]